jgi:hypothetical protein
MGQFKNFKGREGNNYEGVVASRIVIEIQHGDNHYFG